MGIVKENKLTLWTKGSQTEVKLLHSKISFAGKKEFPVVAQQLHDRAYALMNDDRFAQAEKLFRECVKIVGDEPAMLFNLATAIQQQGRTTEAKWMLDDVIHHWPDYFFGKLELARRAAQARDHERAREILDSLRDREEYHVSEYMSLCFYYAELEMNCSRPEAAEPWIEQARQVQPDHPQLPMIERQLKASRFSMNSLFSGLWGS
jgi:hypothetical protein